jgi:hypothetical protein
MTPVTFEAEIQFEPELTACDHFHEVNQITISFRGEKYTMQACMSELASWLEIYYTTRDIYSVTFRKRG